MEFPTEPGLVWPSPRTFFGAPRCDDLSELAADVAFLGVPYDAGTLQPYIRTGQSGGPTLARAAGFNQLDYVWPPTARPEGGSIGWFDIESGRDQLRRLSELPFVRSITAIGLRNVFRAEYEDLRSYGAGIATSLEVMDDGPAGVIERLVPEGGNLYVSIDIDVLDLPIVPGTTLPEPGGLSYRDLRSLLHHTARRGRVVGFDIVELDAPHDVSGATSRVTTWLMVHFLSSIFEAR